MAGLVQLATELQAGSAAAKVGTPQAAPDSGLSAAVASVARDLSAVGAKIGAWADHAAASEGGQAGHLAGLDPEFRPGRTNTIYGDAFDKAGLQTYTARTLTALQQDLGAAADQHAADPAGMAKVLGQKTQAWLAKTLPDVRPEVELAAGKIAFSEVRQATRAAQAAQQQELAAATQLQVAQSLKTIQQRAMGLGLDPTADGVLASDLAGLEQQLTRRGPTGRPLVAPAQARVLIEGAREDIVTARLMGAFDRLPSLQAKETFVARMRDDFQTGAGLAGQFNLDQFRKAESLMRGELRREETEGKIATRQLAGQVELLKRNAEQGIALPDGQMRDLAAAVAMHGDERLTAAYTRAAETLTFHREFRAQPLEVMDRYIEQQTAALRASGAPELEVHKLDVARKLRDHTARLVETDMLSLAAQNGVVVPDLDFSTPQAAVQSLQARAAVADTIGERYGRAPMYFRPHDAQVLQGLAARGPKDLLAVSGAIATAYGPEKSVRALRELGKHAPELAMLGGLQVAGADPRAIEDAAAGLHLRRIEGFKSRLPDSAGDKVKVAAIEVMGPALATLPQTRDAVQEMAAAIYETRALRHGWTMFQPEQYKRAVQAALGQSEHNGAAYGGIGHDGSGRVFGGRKVLVPAWLRQDAVRDAVKALTAEDLAATGSPPTDDSGRPLDIRRVHGAALISVGAGRYELALSDPDGPGAIYAGAGRTGQRYVLDLAAFQDKLRGRLGGAVLGGGR